MAALLRRTKTRRRPRFRISVRKSAAIFLAITVSGCASVSAVKIAGTAVSLALESAGLADKKQEHKEEASYQVALKIQAAEQLNATRDGKPLSLVVRIYQLAGTEAFERLTYAQIATPTDERTLLADELITSREIVVIPGRSYELPQTLPARATAIGVVGDFRAPGRGWWKLAFDARASREHGITIGALACTLAVGTGVLINQKPAEATLPLSGLRCNG